MRLFALFRLAFASALPHGSASPHKTTRRLIMQKARGQAARAFRPDTALPLLVGTRFQVLFHSPPGVLFTFPSRYLFTIGHQDVFSLGRWSSRILTGFLVSRDTWVKNPGRDLNFAYGAITPYGPPSQTVRLSRSSAPAAPHGRPVSPLNPRRTTRADCHVRPV